MPVASIRYDESLTTMHGLQDYARLFLRYALSDLTNQSEDEQAYENYQHSYILFFDDESRDYLSMWCDMAGIDTDHCIKRARQCHESGQYLTMIDCEPVLFGFSRWMLFHLHGRRVLLSKYGFLMEQNMRGILAGEPSRPNRGDANPPAPDIISVNHPSDGILEDA